MWRSPAQHRTLISFRNDVGEPFQKLNLVLRRGPNNLKFYEYVPLREKAAARATKQHPHGHVLYDIQAEKEAMEDVMEATLASANSFRREREKLKAQRRRSEGDRDRRQRQGEDEPGVPPGRRQAEDRHGREEEYGRRRGRNDDRERPQRIRRDPRSGIGAYPDDLTPDSSRRTRSPAPSPSPPPTRGPADGNLKRPSENLEESGDSDSDGGLDPDEEGQRVLTSPRKRRRKDETSFHWCASECGWVFSLLDWVDPLPQEPFEERDRRRDGRGSTIRDNHRPGGWRPRADRRPRRGPDAGRIDPPQRSPITTRPASSRNGTPRSMQPPAPTVSTDTSSSDQDDNRRPRRTDSDALLRPSTPEPLKRFETLLSGSNFHTDQLENIVPGARVTYPSIARTPPEPERTDTTPDGLTRDPQGRLLNARGQLVNELSQLINENGHAVDAEGRLLNSRNEYVNDKGQLVDKYGRVYYESFQDLSDNEEMERNYEQRPTPVRLFTPPPRMEQIQSPGRQRRQRQPSRKQPPQLVERSTEQKNQQQTPSKVLVPERGGRTRTIAENPISKGAKTTVAIPNAIRPRGQEIAELTKQVDVPRQVEHHQPERQTLRDMVIAQREQVETERKKREAVEKQRDNFPNGRKENQEAGKASQTVATIGTDTGTNDRLPENQHPLGTSGQQGEQIKSESKTESTAEKKSQVVGKRGPEKQRKKVRFNEPTVSQSSGISKAGPVNPFKTVTVPEKATVKVKESQSSSLYKPVDPFKTVTTPWGARVKVRKTLEEITREEAFWKEQKDMVRRAEMTHNMRSKIPGSTMWPPSRSSVPPTAGPSRPPGPPNVGLFGERRSLSELPKPWPYVNIGKVKRVGPEDRNSLWRNRHTWQPEFNQVQSMRRQRAEEYKRRLETRMSLEDLGLLLAVGPEGPLQQTTGAVGPLAFLDDQELSDAQVGLLARMEEEEYFAMRLVGMRQDAANELPVGNQNILNDPNERMADDKFFKELEVEAQKHRRVNDRKDRMGDLEVADELSGANRTSQNIQNDPNEAMNDEQFAEFLAKEVEVVRQTREDRRGGNDVAEVSASPTQNPMGVQADGRAIGWEVELAIENERIARQVQQDVEARIARQIHQGTLRIQREGRMREEELTSVWLEERQDETRAQLDERDDRLGDGDFARKLAEGRFG